MLHICNMRLSASWCQSAMSSADRFCVNTKWRWVGVSKGMAVSVLGFRMALVAIVWVVSLLPCTIGLKNSSLPCTLVVKFFAVWMSGCWPRVMEWDRGWVMAFPLVSSLCWGVEYDRPYLNPFCFSEKIFCFLIVRFLEHMKCVASLR